MDNLARKDKPRAINRVDNVIGLFPGVVPGLSPKSGGMSLIVSAARQELASFEARLATMGIRLIVSDETLTEIAKAGLDTKYGVRPLQQAIELEIEYPISKAVLKGKFVARDTIRVLLKDGLVTFEK